MEEEHGHGRVGDLTRFCSSKFRSVERRFSLLGRDTLQPLGRGLDNTPVDPWVVHPACHCSRLRGWGVSNLSEHFVLFHRLLGEPKAL